MKYYSRTTRISDVNNTELHFICVYGVFIYVIKGYLIVMCVNKFSLRSQSGREILFLVLLTRIEALDCDIH
jgi:hypothetical protein